MLLGVAFSHFLLGYKALVAANSLLCVNFIFEKAVWLLNDVEKSSSVALYLKVSMHISLGGHLFLIKNIRQDMQNINRVASINRQFPI